MEPSLIASATKQIHWGLAYPIIFKNNFVIKYCLIIAIALISFTSCKKDVSPTASLNETVDTTVAITQKTGNFIGWLYDAVSGEAKIYEEKGIFTLSLQNMDIRNEPDFHIYVSKEKLPVNFIDLGKLKSIKGNQFYTI